MSLVTINVVEHVATLTIAPVDGLADRAFSDALTEISKQIASSEDVRSVVVTSANQDFCSGWSPHALAEPDQHASPLGEGFESVAALPQPTVAALEGKVHSAGLELALACDIRVAARGAEMAMPETGLAMIPRGGGTQRLPRAVGRAHALRMLLTGEMIGAQEARRIGLVVEVVDVGGAGAAASSIAGAIASRGPIATRMAKEAVHRGTEMTLEQALRYELDLTVLLQTTADRAEGVRAFAAKRPPEFVGR